jgi:hypothetical protein
MTDTYDNAVANHGASLIVEVGLIDDTDTELDNTTIYARQSVSWTTAGGDSAAGVIRPTADIVFNVPAGVTVAGIRFYNSGGDILGEGSVTNETYANDGEFKIVATSTGILHNV